MNYKDYLAEDFLMDKSFQKYCIGTDQNHIDFWEVWISDNSQKLIEIKIAREIYFLLNGGNFPEKFKKDQRNFLEAINCFFELDDKNNILQKSS